MFSVVIANRRLIPLILLTDEATFTRDGINYTHNSHRRSKLVIVEKKFKIASLKICGAV